MSTTHIDGIELYWEAHGSGDPLLLIMGLAADSLAWMFQLPAFSERYRTVVFDNRGVGRSGKPAGPYSIARMADDAAAVLDAAGVERAHVVGVSMGGMIAQELALRHPSRVRGLVLGCTYAKPDAGVERQLESSLAFFGGSRGADGAIRVDLGNVDPMMFFQHLLPTVFNAQFIMTELPKLMQVFSGALQYGFSMDAILAQVGATQAHDTLERLGRIAAPTLVLTGDSDLLIPPTCSDTLAARIPGAKLAKIPGGSHGFNFETPDVFNQAVLEFLTTLPN
jgi:pimeloyl-ACP methyl ester carboxylesterase